MSSELASKRDNPEERAASLPLDPAHEPLGRIPVLSAAVQRLRGEFGDRIDGAVWPGYADKLAGAVRHAIDRLNAENSELESLLGVVTGQLSQLESWAASSSADASDYHQSAIDLEAGVRDQVQSLHRDVAGSTDLDELKLQVQSRLQGVTEHLGQFRAAEERRMSEIEARNQVLQKELDALSARTERLRAELDAKEDLLMHDTLTGVLSRHAYEVRLKEEFARWERHGISFAYTYWDIDNFKAVNDTHGHRAGDQLLKQIATVLDRYTRTSDIVARVGGEEFAIIMPATNVAQAKNVADKLRQLIARSRFAGFAEQQRFSVSCGVTEIRNGDTVTELVERADGALYRAKRAGKNCCIVE